MPTGTEAQYNKAVEAVRAANSVNIPMLKRALNISWLEAGHLIGQLESRGVIGPFDGMKPREILPVDLDAENMRMMDARAEANAQARGRITEKKMQIVLGAIGANAKGDQ